MIRIKSLSIRRIFIASFLLITITTTQAVTAHAIDINVASLYSIFNIPADEIPVFTLNRETGEVIFGDGVSGEELPSGTQNIAGTYETSGGEAGNVLNIYVIPREGDSTLIPFAAFPKDASGDPVLSFIVSGIDRIKLEMTDEGVRLTAVEFTPTPIPEPTTMLLLGSGLFGLWGVRKKFKK